MRPYLFAASFAAALALVSAPIGARADAVVYNFAALPGGVSNCQWFDAHLNDRTPDALDQIAELLYNRAALAAPTPVTITEHGTTALGAPLAGFRYNGRLLCAQSAAVTPAGTTATP